MFAQKVRIISEIGAQNFKKPCAEFRIFWRRIPGAVHLTLVMAQRVKVQLMSVCLPTYILYKLLCQYVVLYIHM
jgi:hypothetical protein